MAAAPQVSPLDILIVLGAQLVREQATHGTTVAFMPAEHTEQRIVAAGVVHLRNMATRFIISGGYNVGVRYWADRPGVLASTERTFSQCAAAQFNGLPSEARLMATHLHERFGVPYERMLLEESASDTVENAAFVKLLLARNWLDLPTGNALRIGLLTSSSHMERAVGIFRAAGIPISDAWSAESLAPLVPSQN